MKIKLSCIAEIVSGATPSTSVQEYYDGDVVWFTPKDLSDQGTKYISKGERNITEDGFRNCSARMIPPYNLLMSSRAPIGLLSINEVECCTNQGFKSLIVDKSKANVDYLYYYIKHHLPEVEALGSGTTFKEVSRASLEKWDIELPDLPTQDTIASVLSSLDRKIALNRKANEVLESMAKQLYDYWFVQFDFPNAEGKPYKSSGGKMVYNETLKREIPEGWEVKPLNTHLKIISGFPFKSETYLKSGKYKVITIKNVQDGILSASSCDFVNSLPDRISTDCVLEINDRLISLTGNCGRVCVVTENDLLLNQRVGKFICKEYLLEFFYHLFLSDEMRTVCDNLAKGAAQANLSPIELCAKEYYIPTSNILSEFNQIVNRLRMRITKNEQETLRLTSLRDHLLPLLMNGQVKVL